MTVLDITSQLTTAPGDSYSAERALIVSATIVFCLAACSRNEGVIGGDPVSRDSAGIEIVENLAPQWVPGREWRLSDAPVVRIGGLDGEPSYELFRVAGALRLSDGRLVIANAGTHELRFYDGNGAFLHTVGRQGDGPGEFQRLRHVASSGRDSIAAYDDSHKRVSIFDGAGRYARQVTVRPDGVPRATVRGIFADRTIFGFDVPFNMPMPTGVVRQDLVLLRISADGRQADTLGPFPGPEIFAHNEFGFGMWGLPFGRSTYYAIDGNHLYTATSDQYEIRVHDLENHLLRIIRRQHQRAPVTREMWDRHVDDGSRRPDDEELEAALRQIYGLMPVPKELPPFTGIHVDVGGNVWVQQYEAPANIRRRVYDVFAPSGVFLGSVAFPNGFRVLQIGDDFVLGRSTGEMDEPYVELWELMKG